jgi:hypothetical protein
VDSQGPWDAGGPDLPPALDGNRLPLDGGTFAYLWLTVTERDTQLPIPARVIFRPVPGAGFADSITSGEPDPQSPGSRTGAVIGPGVVGTPEGVLLQTGQGVVPVPAGTYGLFVTRGPEYEAVQQSITVQTGEVRTVAAELDRTVDTGGWLAADMHIHTGRSFDSALPVDRRIISMVTSGVEVLVPTDHHVNTDLSSLMSALGYGPEVAGQVVGNELNFKEGHAGVYPVTYDPSQPNGGSLPYQAFNAQGVCDPPLVGINCYSGGDAFLRMRDLIPNTTVVTVNHPWWLGGDLGYFTNIGWGVGTNQPWPAPLDSAGTFDALEVLNGYWTRADAEESLLSDWFYLLQQGYRVTALGNSDTHKINWVRSGFPRTWLRLPVDRPGDVTGPMLADAIRHQRAVASTGPFISLTVDGATIGDTVTPKIAGQVTVAVTVDAPAWMTVDKLRVFVGGVQKHTYAIAPGSRPVFTTTFTEPIGGDTFIVAVASGEQPLPPDVVGEYSAGNGYEMTPFALTNPVFVDSDGDGMLQPPLGPPPQRPLWPPPPPPPAPLSPDRKLPLGQRPVPVECEPGADGVEPPLTVPPERLLMPLLY